MNARHRERIPWVMSCPTFRAKSHIIVKKKQVFICYKHSVLTNWGFYEFTFLRDGPYFFKVNGPLSLLNGPLSFKNGLSGPLRLEA